MTRKASFPREIIINKISISDDNEHVVDNMKPCPTQCFHHSDIEDVANDNFSVMSSLFSGAFDHILDMIFQW